MSEEIAISEGHNIKIDQNPAAIYVASLGSKAGQRTMMQSLNLIAGMLNHGSDALSFDWARVRYKHVTAVRSQLQAKYKPATVNRIMAALKGALKAAWQDGQIKAEDYQLAVSVKGVRGETLPAGRELQSGELSALIEACESDQSSAGVRDAAIIALMYSCGLRRAEVITLDLADYEKDAERMKIRGKGNKERSAYVTGGAAQALADWLNLRGEDPGALFVPVNKGGILSINRLTPQAIYNVLYKRASGAGVKHFSPHDMRRTFVSDLLDHGADITTVSKMAGHANVTTTARYDRRPEEAKKKAAGLLHVPYRGKVK